MESSSFTDILYHKVKDVPVHWVKEISISM